MIGRKDDLGTAAVSVRFRRLLFGFALMLVGASSQAATNVSGSITTNTTWTLAGSPYLVTGGVVVSGSPSAAAVLTIEAGVQVQFNQNGSLTVGSGSNLGGLKVLGTASSPVLFTSSQATKTRGYWDRITFSSATDPLNTVLQYATAEYGGSGGVGILYVSGGSPTLQNVTVRETNNYGIYVVQGGLALQSVVTSGTGGSYAMSLPADLTVSSSGAHSFDKPIELRTGNILGTTTWRSLGAPYVSTGGIDVYKNTTTAATLTIDAGVEVRFEQGRGLGIGLGANKGTLTALGTSSAPIVFTSNQTTKTQGYWNGLSFNAGAGSTSILDFVTIEYATTNLTVSDASPTVKNSTLRQSSTYGVFIYGASSAPSLQSTTIRDNGGIGLWLNQGSNLSLQTMTFTGTGGSYAMSLPCDATVSSSGTHSVDKPVELRSGNVVGTTTWRNLGAPYVSTGGIDVYKDTTTAATLTIEPGVAVRFEQGRSLGIGTGGGAKGTLTAQGTSSAPIVFTSNQTAKTRGYWYGLSFQPGSAGLVQFATVEYAGFSGTAGIAVSSSSPTIRNTTVRESGGAGVSVTGSAAPVLVANAFAGETTYAVNNAGTSVLDARASWWNSTSGPSGAASGTGEAVSAGVLTSPWLGAAPNLLYYVSQAQISKLFFSSKNESTTLTATLSAPGSWTLQVLNSSATVVRTYTGTGSTLSQAWDGRDSKKAAVADGTYTLRLTATASTGGQAMAPLVGHVVVTGGTSPVAVISAPMGGAVLRGGDDVSVVGTASDTSDFVSYRVEVGAGSAPTSWSTLTSPADITTPVVDARLATWPTSGLTGSTYTLRLTTKDARSSATAQATVKLMTVLNPQLSQRYFSPNGDGVNETTTFSATLTQTANWTLSFKDSAGVAVRTLTGSGTSVSQVWNGKNDSGAPVAEGTYSYTFQAVEATSGVAAFAVTGLTTVDLNVPTAQITAPTANAKVFDTITITGTAYDPSNFVSYYVDYGTGASPSGWTRLCTSGAPVQNGTLCVWKTNSFRDEILVASGNGVYTFRLTVTDSAGSVKTAQVTVNLDNMLVSGVSASRSTIRPVDGETSTIGFTINQAATVSVRILPETAPRKVYPDQTVETGVVRTLSLGSLASGPHTAVWDGKDDSGRIVTDEAYTYVIEARAASTRFDKFNEYLSPTTTFNPQNPSIPASVLSYDPYKNQFVSWDYSVTAGPGRCGLYVQWLDSQDHWTYFWPQMNTLRTVGTANAFWDGRDQAGNIVSGAGMKSIAYFVGYNPGGTYDYPSPDFCQGIKTNYILVQGSNPRLPGISIKSDPYVMTLSYGGVTRLQYTLQDAAQVTITVRDPLTGVETTILSGASQAAGDQELVWDGRDAAGRLVASEGNYTFSIIATHPVSGQSTVRRGNITVFQ